jgi:ATP-dependent Zn protease
LIAKAIAGEAGVPFFYAGGSAVGIIYKYLICCIYVF